MIALPMRARDRRFVVPTWVNSLAMARAKEHRADTLRRYWAIVDRVLDDPETCTIVMLTDEASRTVQAWACATGSVLQYAYVPPELRKEGLARIAITAALGSYPDRIDITHAWPFDSARFHRQPHHLLRTAA